MYSRQMALGAECLRSWKSTMFPFTNPNLTQREWWTSSMDLLSLIPTKLSDAMAVCCYAAAFMFACAGLSFLKFLWG